MLLVIFTAQLTLGIALITPGVYSLAIWLDRIAPDQRDHLLAVALSLASGLGLAIGPILNVISDRTTARIGRRRPWLIMGLVIGTLGSVLMVTWTSGLALIVGWIITSNGYGIALGMVMVHVSERLEPGRRGRILGISGSIGQFGPITGVLLVGVVAHVPPLIFLVPAAAALVGGGLLAIAMTDPPVERTPEPLRLGQLFSGFGFSPRRHPELSWAWLNKALFFFAISFQTIYTVYFLTDRHALDSVTVAGVVSLTGVIGLGTATAGAIGVGAWSDRIRRRTPVIAAAGVLYSGGLVIVATSPTVIHFVLGAAINSFAIGTYGAVSQALQLDLIPADEAANGRYLAVLGLANQIPQAIGPLVAAGVVLTAGGDYGRVYLAAAALALLSVLATLPLIIRGRARSTHGNAESPTPRGTENPK